MEVAALAPASTGRAVPDRSATAARDFEVLLLSQAIETMLETSVPEGEAAGMSMWRGLLSKAVAEEISGGVGIGLAPGVEAAIQGYGAAREIVG